MLYSTENEEKSSIVERWNRTMKNIMWKYFTVNNRQKYIDVLPSVVDKYNSTYQSINQVDTFRCTEPANYQHVHNALYANVNARKATSPKFHVGNKVCITRKKGTFEKGFTPNWTQVFAISSVKATKPPTYTIKDQVDTVMCIMEKYKLTFTTIARIFQIHQHWTLPRRICYCWMIAS